MSQTTIGGFTLIFNGVTPVTGGYEWSYTIINDGTEKDLSNWVLELFDCGSFTGTLPCSLGTCELVDQICVTPPARCETFRGIKFDNLPSDQFKQTFTFTLPIEASVTEGCFYLKYGLNRVCGLTQVPDCAGDPPCPPCPDDSLRQGQVFTYQAQLPESSCSLQFRSELPSFEICVAGITLEENQCNQMAELTLCEGTPSEQTLQCPVVLDYAELTGNLQLIWQLPVELQTVCSTEAVNLTTLATTDITIGEICYYCQNERPDFTLADVCKWFEIVPIEFTADGLLTYRVTFTGCSTL